MAIQTACVLPGSHFSGMVRCALSFKCSGHLLLLHWLVCSHYFRFFHKVLSLQFGWKQWWGVYLTEVITESVCLCVCFAAPNEWVFLETFNRNMEVMWLQRLRGQFCAVFCILLHTIWRIRSIRKWVNGIPMRKKHCMTVFTWSHIIDGVTIACIC